MPPRPRAVTLLEPVDKVSVLVSDEYVGSVMSDLSGPTRGGRAGRRVHRPRCRLECARRDPQTSHGPRRSPPLPRHEPMPPQIAKKLQVHLATTASPRTPPL